MFRPRKAFQSVEQYTDHLAEAIKARFDADEEGVIASLKSENEGFRAEIRAIKQNADSNMATLLQRVDAAERSIKSAIAEIERKKPISGAVSQVENTSAGGRAVGT